MQRSITQYMACKPHDMAHNQSRTAIQFAFEDMRTDIIRLHDTLKKFAGDVVEGVRPDHFPLRATLHQRAMEILDELK